MDENIKQLIVIAEALETFKNKVYARMNMGDKEFDDFVMNNSPRNYNLIALIKRIQQEIRGGKENGRKKTRRNG